MALGARGKDVMALIMGKAAILIAVGLTLGILGSLAATRLMGTLLYEVSPFDLGTYVALSSLLAATVLLASYVPARRAARLQIGSNVFEVSSEGTRNYLLQHPWIEEATVVRKLPGRVRIEIVEREPVALVALDQLYLVSNEGAVFKRLGVDDPVDLPVITGIASERFYDDLDYRTAILLRSMALLQDYEGAGLAKREPVSEIHFEGANGIELFVGHDGMNVRLGNGQHRQKLRRFRQVLERLAREKTRPSYVYLDNVRSPERVTVRLP